MAECAFDACTCPVSPHDDYCGPSCRLGIGDRGEPCKCGHSDCKNTVGEG